MSTKWLSFPLFFLFLTREKNKKTKLLVLMPCLYPFNIYLLFNLLAALTIVLLSEDQAGHWYCKVISFFSKYIDQHVFTYFYTDGWIIR